MDDSKLRSQSLVNFEKYTRQNTLELESPVTLSNIKETISTDPENVVPFSPFRNNVVKSKSQEIDQNAITNNHSLRIKDIVGKRRNSLNEWVSLETLTINSKLSIIFLCTRATVHSPCTQEQYSNFKKISCV